MYLRPKHLPRETARLTCDETSDGDHPPTGPLVVANCYAVLRSAIPFRWLHLTVEPAPTHHLDQCRSLTPKRAGAPDLLTTTQSLSSSAFNRSR